MLFFEFLPADNGGTPTSLAAVQHNIQSCKQLLQLKFPEFLMQLTGAPQAKLFVDSFLKARRRLHEESQTLPVCAALK